MERQRLGLRLLEHKGTSSRRPLGMKGRKWMSSSEGIAMVLEKRWRKKGVEVQEREWGRG